MKRLEGALLTLTIPLFLCLALLSLCPAAPAGAEFLPNPTKIDLQRVRLTAGAAVEVRFEVATEGGAKLTPDAPCRLKVQLGAEGKGSSIEQRITSEVTKVSLTAPGMGNSSDLKATAVLYYCKISDKALCYLKSFIFSQPVDLIAEPGNSAPIVLKAVIE